MSGDRRVRRPAQYEVLIRRLEEEAGFPTKREVILFAAALGKSSGQRVSFEESSETIRYETMINAAYAETLIKMIAASEEPDQPEILSQERWNEQIRIFEEYVNGGLELLQAQSNSKPLPLDQLVVSLIVDALDESNEPNPASAEELLKSSYS